MTRSYKIGDEVWTPEGIIGVVIEIDKTPWRDRGERLWHLHRYYVPTPTPGTPVVWWLARQLDKAE